MRSILITSAIAASLLTAGFAATAAAAHPEDDDAAVTPTTVPFDLGGLGLTPEQTNCLMSNVVGIDINDMSAVMNLMTQCGIDPTALGTGVGTPTVPAIGVATTLVPVTVTGTATIDPAVAASVLLMLGIDPTSAQCIESGLLAATTPGDDTEALAILQSCGLSLNDMLIGVLAVNDLAAGTGATLPVVSGGPTTAGAATDNPLVQQLIDLVRDQYGIDLTPEQATCLLDNVTGLDPNDMAATIAVMEQCGISLTDLSPG